MIDNWDSKVCPKCGSTDIWIGAFPLSCNACDWHYLNEYPCDTCGKPSRSSMGTGDLNMHRCRDHPFTDEDRRRVFAKFAEAVWGKK